MTPRCFRPLLSALTAAVLLAAPTALADWVGDIRLKNAPPPGAQGGPVELKGKMYGRKGLVRMDMELPPQQQAQMGNMSIIFNLQMRTGTMLMHKQKLATQRSLDELPMKLPGACTGLGQDFDACFKAQGYVKTGSEKVNGHPATIYEGNVPSQDGKQRRQKLWRPTDLAEVPYIRSQTFDATGRAETELDVLNIQVGPQPDSRFAIPPDYQQQPPSPASRMGNLKPEDLQGKSPEEIEKLIRERMGPKPKGK
jgi:hypothetical protein